MKENNPHKFFRKRKDYTKWDNFVAQIDLIDLSDEDKERGREAIRYLENALGKHFLSEVLQFGHPVLNYFFINSANLARIQLIDFVDSLRAVEKSQNFHTIIKKIRKAKDFPEGSTILEAAYRFHKAGFEVAFDEEVSFTEGGKLKTKKPDIKITNPDSMEEIYIEVSETGRSQADINNSRTFNTLFFLIQQIIRSDPEMTDFANPRHVLPYVKILRSMSEKELIDITFKIEKLVEKVRKDGEFQEMVIQDMVEVAVSPFNDHSKAKKWAKQRNMTNFVESCSFNPNELRRVINRLDDELKQLPTDKPGVVILWNNANLLFYLHDIPSIINEVANKIAAHPHIFGVILNHNYGWEEPNTRSVEIEDHLFVSNTGRDLISRNTLIVRNKYFNLSLTNSTREELWKSFVYSSNRN